MQRMRDTISSYTCVAIFFMRSSSASIASMCSCFATRLWSSTSTACAGQRRAAGGERAKQSAAQAAQRAVPCWRAVGRAVRCGGRCDGEGGGRAVGGRWEGHWAACAVAQVASLLHVEVDLVNGGALVAHADVVLAGGVRRHREVSSGVLVLEEHLPRGRTDLCVALVISTRRRPVAGEQTSDRDRLRDAALVRGLELEGHTVARAGVERKGEGKDAARHRSTRRGENTRTGARENCSK